MRPDIDTLKKLDMLPLMKPSLEVLIKFIVEVLFSKA